MSFTCQRETNPKKRKVIAFVALLTGLICVTLVVSFSTTQSRLRTLRESAYKTTALRALDGYYQTEIAMHRDKAAFWACRLSTGWKDDDPALDNRALFDKSEPEFTFAIWYTEEGDVQKALNRSGIPNSVLWSLSTDYMCKAALERQQTITDLVSLDGHLYMVTTVPINDAKDGIIIGTPFDPSFVNRASAILQRDVSILYGNELKYTTESSFQDMPTVLSSVVPEGTHTLEVTETGTLEHRGTDYLYGMTSFLDFDKWEQKGWLVLSEPQDSIVPDLSTRLLVEMILFVLATSILLSIYIVQQTEFMLDVDCLVEERLKRKKRIVLAIIAMVLPALVAIGGLAKTTVETSQTLSDDMISISTKVVDAAMGQRIDSIRNITYGDQGRLLNSDSETDISGLGEYLGSIFDFVILKDDLGRHVSIGARRVPEEKTKLLSKLQPGSVSYVGTDTGVLISVRPRVDSLFSLSPVVAMGYYIDQTYAERLSKMSATDIAILDEAGRLLAFTKKGADLQLEYSPNKDVEDIEESFTQVHINRVQHKLALLDLDNEERSIGKIAVVQSETIYENSMRAYWGFLLGCAIFLALAVTVSSTQIVLMDKPRVLRNMNVGYVFLLPGLIWLIWWAIGPMLFSFYLSFHRWNIILPAKPFMGLDNYIRAINDPDFWNAIKNTAIYLLQIPIGMALSLGLALVVDKEVKGMKLIRTIYYIPAITSEVVIAMVWYWIYNVDFGILNHILSFVGAGPFAWLQSSELALFSIMIMTIWSSLGYRMIIFLAGLRGIPVEYYEAAQIDGAGWWHQLLYVTLPLLKPTTFFILVTSIISSFQVFTPVQLLTKGGPAGATDVVVYRIYFEAWNNLDMGYAAALSWFLFLFVFAFTLVQFRLMSGGRISYGE